MYTFIILYPYASQYKHYIHKTFDVVYNYQKVKLTTPQMLSLYSHAGYNRRLATKKVRVNQLKSNRYEIFLIRTSCLRKTLYKKRKLRKTIATCETFKVNRVYNMFHSLDTVTEKLYMLRYLYPHTGNSTLAAHLMYIIGIM